jgi:hypothetical protein
LWAKDKYMSRLDPAAVARLEKFVDFALVSSDRDLIRQDEYGNFMIVLLSGTIAVDRLQPWGERLRLTEARPGDILGEMSLLDSGIRFSACVTSDRMRDRRAQCRGTRRHDDGRAPAGRLPDGPAGPQAVHAPARGQCAPVGPPELRQNARSKQYKDERHGTRSGNQIHQRPARLMISRNGSDLFITGDFPPAIKVDGKVTKVSPQPLNAGHTLALARSIMNDKQVAEFERTKECNFAISPPAWAASGSMRSSSRARSAW